MKKLIAFTVFSLLIINSLFIVEARQELSIAKPSATQPSISSSGVGSLVHSSSGSKSSAPITKWVWTGSDWILQDLQFKNGKVLDCDKYKCIPFDMNSRKIVAKPHGIQNERLQSLKVDYLPINWYQHREYW